MALIEEKCLKFNLPNGKKVDILSEIFIELKNWIQYENDMPESGGYIVGYENIESGNVTLEAISPPYSGDICSRVHFGIRDKRHKVFLEKAMDEESFYMGVWHTHPQQNPIPSSIDWGNWKETLEQDITASEYIFYIIAGTRNIRVWVGDRKYKKIIEILECEKEGERYKTL